MLLAALQHRLQGSCPFAPHSIASAKKRPQKPILSTTIASTPANGPRPTIATKSRAQTRSGTVRQTAIRIRDA
jgi:hypothetical protein